MAATAHTVFARWRHAVKYRAIRKTLQKQAVVAKRERLQQQLQDAEMQAVVATLALHNGASPSSGKTFAGLLMGRVREDITQRMLPYPQFAS